MRKAPNNLQAAGASGEQLTFLEPPPFCPEWPRPGTLAARALALFLDGRALDHGDFLGSCASWRLAAVVFQLRTLGWPVEAVEIPAPTIDQPARHIALYRLAPRYVALALAASTGGAR